MENNNYNLGKWGIIDGPLMREVLENFFKNPDYKDKVLEIQRVRSIVSRPKIRAFIGQRFKMTDYMEFNMATFDALKKLGTAAKMIMKDVPDFTEADCSLCTWEDGPKIVPIYVNNLGMWAQEKIDGKGFAQLMLDVFGETVLEEKELEEAKHTRLILYPKPKKNLGVELWMHETEPGKYRVPGESTEDRVFRVRIMDYDTWKSLTDEYIRSGFRFPEALTQDDIKREDIITQ